MNIKNLTKKEQLKVAGIVLVFIAGIVLLILPADFFDTGQSLCVSVLLFDMECYGCGMTRAIQHLIHLDIQEAYHFNKLAFAVLPLSMYLIIADAVKLYKKMKAPVSDSDQNSLPSQ